MSIIDGEKRKRECAEVDGKGERERERDSEREMEMERTMKRRMDEVMRKNAPCMP